VRSPGAPRAPKANAYTERWVRTVRTESLHWIVILNRRHLERVQTVYIDHYNTGRPIGIDLDIPMSAPTAAVTTLPSAGRIERHDVLGGLSRK